MVITDRATTSGPSRLGRDAVHDAEQPPERPMLEVVTGGGAGPEEADEAYRAPDQVDDLVAAIRALSPLATGRHDVRLSDSR